MTNRTLENRIDRLEQKISPEQLPRFITIFAEQCGEDGETIPQESDEEAIARHLAEHPEHTGQKFNFARITFVHGKWNDQGELVCENPECPNFKTVITAYR